MAAVLAAAQTPAGAVGGSGANIFTTLVRHPGLVRRWLPFGGKLMAGDLPPAHRELMVLRTAWRCAAEYEWGQHVLIATALGVPAATIERVKAGPEHTDWSTTDAALLRAVD
jgi:alkylhydroperoxidase family enzyme